MSEEAKINFYKVHRCGYYLRGNDLPEFGNLRSTLIDLRQWAFDGVKPLAETCTYQINNGDSFLNTYCFDMHASQNNDIVLTTWNETETLDGAMATVNGGDPAGQAQINTTDIPAGHIPGYPTYFWFIPDKKILATIRFGQRLNGHSGLKLLLSEFLAKSSSHVVYKESNENNDIEIIGYRENDNAQIVPVLPYFRSAPEKLPGPMEYLRNNVTKIKKTIRKSVLQTVNQDDRGLWEKLLNNIGIINTSGLQEELKIKAEFPYSPTLNELNEIIKKWECTPESKWTDVGFEFKGESDIKWLSHALVKTTIDLDVVRDKDGIISAKTLSAAISNKRDQLFTLLSL